MIRQDVEQLLGQKVDNFEFSLSRLDRQGKLTQKVILELLSILYRHIESIEGTTELEESETSTVEQVGIYNPELEDFTFKMRRDEDNKLISYTMKGQEITYFEPKHEKVVKDKLATYLLNKRGVKTNVEDEDKKVIEEISVKL